MPSHWTIAGNEAGTRLDKFLAHRDRLGSRGRALAALERRKVFLNDVEATPGQAAVRLAEGDVIRVWIDRPGSAKRPPTATRTAGDLRILYEDDELIVVDKPAGLLAVPLERRRAAPSVYDLLEAHLRSARRRPFVVHRIDRDTSGLVLFAKNARAGPRENDLMVCNAPWFKFFPSDWLLSRTVRLMTAEQRGIYIQLLCEQWYGANGLPSDEKALIQKETHPRDARGADAISDYRVIERFAASSLIEVRLQTGKRNQIRLQARLRGHTLVGEERYVYGPDTLRPIAFERQALHAHRLAFRHPADGRELRFESPLPADLENLLDRLRKQA